MLFAMRLFHATGVNGLLGILDNNQCIAVSVRDQVVWLTDHKESWIRRQASIGAEATTARITVELRDDEVIPWDKWREVKFSPEARSGLETSARSRGYGDPSTWYVIERPVPCREWVQIVRIADAEIVWDSSQGQSSGTS